MSDDLLKAATRALKEETDADAADGRFTRARVMASLHQTKVKRRTRLAFVLPVAACLAAGTAWAGATGRLPAVFHAISEAVTFQAPPRATAPKRTPTATKPEPRAAPPASSEPAPPKTETEPVKPTPAEPAPSVERAPAAKPSPAPSSSGTFADRDGDLYRLAHEAHFAGHDYARALPAWEAYLRAAPSGRLATEARYNRAICLLRLGRTEEARTALKPFALGALGYRQSEAQQLLNELGE
jgi:TolA-binding protein